MERLALRWGKRTLSGLKPDRFLVWKPAIFAKVKEIKHLRGGVAPYAAQLNEQIDAEMGEKGGFRPETS
jgi:hypothetical protein